jgi:hypothetical protein
MKRKPFNEVSGKEKKTWRRSSFIKANDLPRMTIRHKYYENEDIEDSSLDYDQVSHKKQVELN